MKSDFALSLSFEGIGLLYREVGGWRLLGEVPLASEDLPAALGALRDMGDAITADFRCVLVLPNDQIRFLDLDTGRARDEVRRVKAAEALEAATPYKVDDLSFDISANGRMTHIAAVARETLAEAEGFAVEHGFRPVAFTAIPPEDAFPKAPDFGPTAFARSRSEAPVEHDPVPIEITARGPLPKPEPKPPLNTDSEQKTGERPESDRGADADAKPVKPEITSGQANGTTDAAPQTTAEAVTPVAAATKPVDSSPEDDAPTGFVSIRARRGDDVESSKALSGVTRDGVSVAAPVILPPSGETADDVTDASAPLRFDPASLVKGLRAGPPVEMTDEADDDPAANGTATSFFSRRGNGPNPALAAPNRGRDPEPQAQTETDGAGADEKRRLTVFGARERDVGGKPRFLGLALTVLLLLFLAAVAAWATLFLEDGVAGLFGRDATPQIAVTAPDEAPVETPVIAAEDVPAVTTLATLPPDRHDGILDLRDEPADGVMTEDEVAETLPEAPAEAPADISETDAHARYAVTGIWERGPDQPATPTIGQIDDIYIASIDPAELAHDAIALPDAAERSDMAMGRQPVPPPAGTQFQFDENGLVVATAEGALTPEGITVFLGKPSVLPPAIPKRIVVAEALSDDTVKLALLAERRPRARPTDMADQVERSQTGGYTLDELAAIRPKMRPETAKAQAEQDTTKTDQAVVASLKPRVRPSNFAQIVDRAQPRVAAVATPVAATVTPSIPSSASVARQATIENAINLGKVNLIGVYGTANDRRALVRLPDSRYKKVKVGDSIDGGKVVAIGDDEMRYQKGGRNVVLKLPKG